MPPPLYGFTVGDMEPDHRVLFQCACGHRSYMTKDELLRPREGIPFHRQIQPYHKILGLAFFVRCSLCRKRGRVEITLIRFAPF